MTPSLVARQTALNFLYLVFYRVYIALKESFIVRLVRGWPLAQTKLEKAKEFIKRRALRSRTIWVQVQSGFAQGLWMRLRIPEEAGFWRGEHEPGVQNAISAMVRPGDVVYDVGAHLGSLALGATRLVGASGCVVAFDGDPQNVERLRENSQRNHLCVEAVHAAVWSHPAEGGIPFRRGSIGMSHGGVEADGHRPVLGNGQLISVPVTTLDDFVAEGGLPPQLIKIDVEGGEYEVLRGAANLFLNQRPFIIVEIHHQAAAEQIRGWLEQVRYSGEWRVPAEKFPCCLIAWPFERAPHAPLEPEAAK
jgi:FkbM family methyltransferase